MKRILLLLFFLLSLSVVAQPPSLHEVRRLYQKAESSEAATENLLERLQFVGEEEPVLLAYKASGTMLMAKFVFSPFSKLSYFNKGKKMLQKAVDAAPEVVEIRFLRFALQSSTPGFLGYKGFMEEDKIFLLRELPNLGEGDLRQLILSFLKNSGYLNEAEKQSLNIINKR